MDRMKNVRAIVSVSPIADSDRYIFQDNEPVLALERLPLDSPRLHRAFAKFTAIRVHNLDSSVHYCDLVKRTVPSIKHLFPLGLSL